VKNVGVNTSPLALDSRIDRGENEKKELTTRTSSTEEGEEAVAEGAPLSEEVEEHPEEEVKKKKYGRSTYMEMRKKHKKLRVLLEEREKYAVLSPEEEEGEKLPGSEESVDEILKSLKGDE